MYFKEHLGGEGAEVGLHLSERLERTELEIQQIRREPAIRVIT